MNVEHTFDPWAAANRLGIRIIYAKLRYARGYTDGCLRIWVDSRLTACEARVTITHEISHIVHGHVGEQPDHIEDMIRKVTARWLVPWPQLVNAWGDQLTFEDIADSLCVTADVIRDRIAHATPGELQTLRKVAKCDWQAA